jgi:hypothetical protein
MKRVGIVFEAVTSWAECENPSLRVRTRFSWVCTKGWSRDSIEVLKSGVRKKWV